MPGMDCASLRQSYPGLNASYTPNPMIPIATSATTVKRAMALHGRGWLTLTGAIGGRAPPPDREPPPLAPGPAAFAGDAFAGEAFEPEPAVFEPVDLAAGLAPAAGRLDGRRPPPVCGLLMLMGPRRDRYGSCRL